MKFLVMAALLLLSGGCVVKTAKVALAPPLQTACKAGPDTFLAPFETYSDGERILIVFCVHKDWTAHLVEPPPEVVEFYEEGDKDAEEL